MPSVYFPYINIALDAFALVVIVIIFASCLKEFSRRNPRARYFMFLLSAIGGALIFDIIGWCAEGHVELSYLTIASNTLASCAGQFAIICFMGYLKENLHENSKAAAVTLKLFFVLCVLSVGFSVGNAFFGYAFSVSELGHWEHSNNVAMGIVYLLYPILSIFSIILMAVFAKSSTKVNRLAFIVYTLFPIVGVILDYTIHGLSLTYVGLTISALVIYTNIYLRKQKIIESQKNALMLSQINPHFVYNTLSTIASMCDISPSQAKHLTIDFSRYLRQNLSSLSSEDLIPFEQELSHIECYLKIEKARFGDRLNTIYSVQCKDFSVPPLSLQPLVENAVKHGITKQSRGGTVKISTYQKDEDYVIEIIDDGVGFNTESANMDIGIKNAKSRIAALCKGDLTIKSTEGIGTRVTVEIPKKKGKRQ